MSKKSEVKSEKANEHQRHRELRFGKGQIGVYSIYLTDEPDKKGLLLRPGQTEREVGSKADGPDGDEITFTKEDVFLSFSNPESIDVVIDQLKKVRAEMTKTQPANA